MKEKRTTKKSKPKVNAKAKGINLKAYTDRANESARHFVGTLCQGLTIDIPAIRGKTAKERMEKQFKVLDRILDAFTSAQSDAIKLAGAQVADALGLPPFWLISKKRG